MNFWKSFVSGTSASATDQTITMGSQPDPRNNRQNAPNRTNSAPVTAPSTIGASNTGNSMISDDLDEEEEVVSSPQQTLPNRDRRHLRDAPQHIKRPRIAERDDQVNRGQVRSEAHSGGSMVTTSQGRRVQSNQPDKDSVVPNSSSRSSHSENSSNIQRRDDACWHLLSERVGSMSADMRDVQRALERLQRDTDEKAALQKTLENTRDALQKTTAEAEALRKKWNKTASQLRQLRSQAAGLYQLTDGDLTRSVEQLRYTIRAFSSQYFGGKLTREPESLQTGRFWRYMCETTPECDRYQVYLMSEANGPIVIQSFLWRVLAHMVFEQFFWAPWLKESVAQLYMSLKPGSPC